MASPVELTDLPIASSADNTDIMLLRKGLTDYQATVKIIQNILIQNLTPPPLGFLDSTDLMLANVSGVNYQVRFSQVGLVKDTIMWFGNGAIPPMDWATIPNSGDRLLAVSDGTNNYQAQSAGVITSLDNWQQLDAILDTSQIPPHTHTVPAGKDSTSGSANPGFARRAENLDNNTTITTDNGTGQSKGHNHGKGWRPAANIGCLGKKIA